MKNFTNFRTALMMLSLFFCSAAAFAQTVLLNPAGNGGFESGTTFAANGWTTANGAPTARVWYLGTAQAGYSGARGAFIGNSTSTVGNNGATRTVHLYRALAIPAGATNIQLSFKYKQSQVDETFDFLTVNMASGTPTAGIAVAGTQIVKVDPSVAVPYSSFTTVNAVIPDSFANGSNNLVFTYNSDNATPNGQGAIDDVSVTYTPAPDCTGAPTAGTAVADKGSACTAETFTVNLQGASAASALAYQWFSSADNITYAPIPAATNPSYTGTLSVSTYYRAEVTCTPSGQTATSLPVVVNFRANCYCTASSTNTSTIFEKISNVTLANLNNSSSSFAGYEDFTLNSATIARGTAYPISISTVNSYNQDQVFVYIDYNQDGLFTGPGETVFTSPVGLNYNGTFTVPYGALEGKTRMRIRLHDSSDGANTTPCGTATYGQVEDYTVNIVAPAPCSITTVWNGTAWSQFTPMASQKATFEGDYASSADLAACELTVNSGTVIVNAGNDFTIGGPVTVAGGSLTFENNANLLQTTNAANTGNIKVKRNATMRRLDYVYWGSPVAGQDLKLFSPQTVSPPVGASRFYTMNEATNAFAVISEPNGVPFALAKGYMLRAPNNFPVNGSQATFNGEFNGVPNNGNAAIAITNTPGTGQGFNMLGNPYPSTVSANLFLAQNPGALYFWAHANQNAASGANYATYTTFGTAAAAGGATPDGSIAVGQGFLLKTTASGTATFTNAIRTGNNSALFFRNANVEKSRIWLNLSSEMGTQNQILVGYMEGATIDADVSIDAKQIEGSISNIASLIGDQKYNIQARALPFVNTDEVPLSFNALSAGTFTIAIDHVDGLFSGDQNVYIKDNVAGITHNVKESGYTFAAEAGVTTNRFSVVFQDTTLGIEDPGFDANNVVVFKNNNVLNINSGSVTMSGVKVFDIRGRLVFEQSGINANTAVLTNLRAEQEVLLVQVTSTDNRVVTKKVVY